MKSPDQICDEYSKEKVKVTINQLDADYILIEGNADALKFLGKLILAQAHFKGDCGFHISPNGAGSTLFSDKSTIGIYIHRQPCSHKEFDEKK